MKEKIDKLKSEYLEIFSEENNRPKWAVNKKKGEGIVLPTIPFVGKYYNETRILLYASAENLKNYYGQLDKDDKAINRHRHHFEKPNDSIFPNVHISPIDNGGLVNVIAYVAMKLQPSFNFNTPRELLEGVGFANFGKFSIEVNDKSNIDYANNYKKLSCSLEYIKADLNILKPEILIIPSTIFNHGRIRNFIKDISSEIKVIPIYQIHHFNINRKDRIAKFSRKSKEELGILANWQSDFVKSLQGKTNENFYSFYTYLDSLMNSAFNH